MGDAAAPMLEDAVFHRLGTMKAPDPVALDLKTAWEQFAGGGVTTDAKLLNRQAQPDGLRLLLQQRDVFFDANLPPAAPPP